MTFQLEPIATAFCALQGCSLLGAVGEGAFKETYQIELPTGDHLALKVYRQGFSAERTNREIDAMVRCSHQHIGKLSSVGTIDHSGVTYVVSLEEFFGGGTLSDRLSGGRLLTAADTSLLGELLIDATAHIASHRLVHRDLKPDNIMFRDQGMTPVIVDFGLVRDLGQQSLTLTWVMRGPGTPLFAPPEQLLNEKALIDWRADQFSLATVLSFAALGMHPYAEPGDTSPATVDRVANRTGPSQQFLTAARAARLESLVKMAAPYPVQRFRTPTHLAAAWPRGI